MKKLTNTRVWALAALLFFANPSMGEDLTNGVAGDGAFRVAITNAGGILSAQMDPTGSRGPTSVVYMSRFFVQNNGGGAVALSDSTRRHAAFTPGRFGVQSSGDFTGPNGTIYWRALTSLEHGSQVCVTTLILATQAPAGFGNVSLISYLDADVAKAGENILVQTAPGGDDDFELLTLDKSAAFGLSLAVDLERSTGATWRGWAAKNNTLQDDIIGGDLTYNGIRDPNWPQYQPADPLGLSSWGPADISAAIALNLKPGAQVARIKFATSAVSGGHLRDALSGAVVMRRVQLRASEALTDAMDAIEALQRAMARQQQMGPLYRWR